MSKPIPIPRNDSDGFSVGPVSIHSPGTGIPGYLRQHKPSPVQQTQVVSPGNVPGIPSASGSTEDLLASETSSMTSRLRPMGTPKFLRGEIDPIKFKTSMCQYRMRGEVCPYEPNCAFAHSPDELRTVHDNASAGVSSVNSMPRDLVDRHTSGGAFGPSVGGINPMMLCRPSPPRPSYMSATTSASSAPSVTGYSHNPYLNRVTRFD